MKTYSIRIVDKRLNTIYKNDFTNKKVSDVINYISGLYGLRYKLIATGSSSVLSHNDNVFLCFSKKRWYER